MKSQLRDSGIDVVGRVPWGTHFTLWYDTRQDLLDTVVPYFAAGLRADELCEWVYPDAQAVQTAKHQLRALVPDLDARVSEGQMLFKSAEEAYMPDGHFRVARLIARWEEIAAWVEAQPIAGFRRSGDASWLRSVGWKPHREYEIALHQALRGTRMMALCTFALARRDAADVFDIAQTHHFAIVRRQGEWEVLETPELARERAKAKVTRTKRIAHERALRAGFEAALEERTRLAREIHDTLVQGATGTALQLRAVLPHLRNAPSRAVDALRQALHSAEASVREARQAVWDMRVPVVAERGLVKAIELEIEQRRIAPRVTFQATGRTHPLPAEIEDTVFRIGREAMANAERYANARHVAVTLTCTSRSVRLRVSDDGVGFTPEPRVQARAGKWGLLGMRERAERLGAALRVSSRPGKGTTIDLRVAVPRAKKRRPAARSRR